MRVRRIEGPSPRPIAVGGRRQRVEQLVRRRRRIDPEDLRELPATELELTPQLMQVAALGGSVAMARPTDTRGPRWAVSVLLLWWIGVVVAAYFATTKLVFWFVAVLAGLGLGGIQASSRAFMSRLIPDGREAEFFDSFEELLRKCRHYLEHDDERRRVAAAGLQRCIDSGYSNKHRMARVLEHLATRGAA